MPAGRSQLTGNSAGGRGAGSSSNYKEKRGGKPPDSIKQLSKSYDGDGTMGHVSRLGV